MEAAAPARATIARLDGFLDMLAAERGRSALTLSTYRECLASAADWLRTKNLKLETAGSDDLRAWLEDTQTANKPISAATQAKRLSALKHYYRFLISEGERADNPVTALERPRAKRKLPQPLGQAALAKLLETAGRNDDTLAGLRLALLLELLYGGGLRASEVVGLSRAAAGTGIRNNIQNPQPYLIVRGKGDKERIAPLSPAAVTALIAYLAALKQAERHLKTQNKNTSPFLFPSRGKSGHLTRQSLFLQLKDLARAAGIDPARVRPHGMRHAFATHLLEGGADLRSVQLLLGHADIGTTQIYTAVTQSRLAKTLAAHHPLAKRRKPGR